MPNPFANRATEWMRSNTEAFLSIVTPDPVLHYFQPHAEQDRMYQRLVMIHGTPGSGKTTIAKLFELVSLATLMRSTDNDN
jgi:hypothetical protein